MIHSLPSEHQQRIAQNFKHKSPATLVEEGIIKADGYVLILVTLISIANLTKEIR